MTDLEKAGQNLEKAVREKEVLDHEINRNENRLRNALKKQDSARTHRLIVEGAELEYVFEGMGHTPDVNTMCYDSPRKSRLEILEKALNRWARNVVTPKRQKEKSSKTLNFQAFSQKMIEVRAGFEEAHTFKNTDRKGLGDAGTS